MIARWPLRWSRVPCALAPLVNARIARVIYADAHRSQGRRRSIHCLQICDDSRLNHQMQITAGVLAEDCSRLLSDFFRAQRKHWEKEMTQIESDNNAMKRSPAIHVGRTAVLRSSEDHTFGISHEPVRSNSSIGMISTC